MIVVPVTVKKPYLDPADLPEVDDAIIARIRLYLRPYGRRMLTVALLIAGGAALQLIPPIFVKRIVDEAIPRGDLQLLITLAIGMIGGPLIAGLLEVWQKVLTTKVAEQVMLDLRVQLFKHLHEQPLGWFTAARPGEALSRVLNDVAGVGNAVSKTLVDLVDHSLALSTTAVLLIVLDWRLALVALAILPAFVIPTRSVGLRRKKLKRQAQAKMGDVTGILAETLTVSGALLLKVSGTEKVEAERLRERAQEVLTFSVRSALVGRWFQMLLGLFETVGPALVFAGGGWMVIHGHAKLGTLVAFTTLLKRLYGPARQLAGVRTEVITSYAFFERIFAFLDTKAAIQNAPDARTIVQPKGELVFADVSLRLDGDAEILRGITLKIGAGETVALVGPSGAGKSSLVALVPRLYDPASGSVSIDGIDLRAVTLESLRANIGVVTQETVLFHASVLDNLRYGCGDVAREDVERAARDAQIHDVIAALPNGYDTLVGDRGYRLSGGERQRLAIARAMLKDPRILILDEATSALDAHNERLVQAALEPLLHGRTALVIAHRLATIRDADRIVVMKGGTIVEQGTHPALMAAGGLYASLAREQGLS